MGKGNRVRGGRGAGRGNRNSTVSPGTVTVDGAREHGPLFAGYFHVQALAGKVVVQVGTREVRRLILLTAQDAAGMAGLLRAAAAVAIEQYPQLLRNGFPRPDLGSAGTDDEFFARVNAWAQELRWIEPAAELGATAGVGVAHAHVVFVQPMPGEPGRYTVTFFGPHDVAQLATMLETSGQEAAEMDTVLNLVASLGAAAGQTVVPEPAEIFEQARTITPWPPLD